MTALEQYRQNVADIEEQIQRLQYWLARYTPPKEHEVQWTDANEMGHALQLLRYLNTWLYQEEP